MYTFSVTPELLIVLIAGLLALVFDYFPLVAKWFDGLEVAAKRQLNAGLVLLIAIGIFVGDCYGLFATNLICTIKGGFDTLYIVFLAITVNQGVHTATKPTEAVKAKIFGLTK